MAEPKTEQVVGISISQGADLAALGFGPEHLNEISILVARTVLRPKPDGDANAAGWKLAYGGDLRPQGFTRNLFAVVRGESGGGDGDRRSRQRLYSYFAWPHYLALSKSEEAELINVCNFVRIRPEDAGGTGLRWDQPVDDPALREAGYVASRCLSVMREWMTKGGAKVLDGHIAPALAARIILGGRVFDYSSFMPGLFEELLLAFEHRVPIYCLGGLGGAAGVLARAIAAPAGSPLPEELGLDWQRKQTGTVDGLIAAYAKHPDVPQPEAFYARLTAAVNGLRDELRGAGAAPLSNGLTAQQNRELMETQDPATMRRLIALGLGHIGVAN